MKLIVGRIFSAFLTVAWAALLGARLVLDLIGYSTAPEDLEVAHTRLDQFLEWLLSVPWWAVLGFALISTLWLIWVSWPRQQRNPTVLPVQQEPFASRSAIRLHYRAGDHTPELLSQENIFRYYSLKSGVRLVQEDGKEIEHMVTALFLVYERPTNTGSIRVRFPGKAVRYEVKDFGSRHAIVCFTDIPRDVTLEVETY